MKTFLRNMAIVVAKEIMDALRDRRTLLRLLVPAVLMGPLLLLAVSGLISSLEDRAEKHEVLVAGMEHAPSLRNYLERQTYTIKTAPPDYEARLHASTLLEPVLVIKPSFERDLLEGERPTVELVSDSANQRACAGLPPLQRLMAGFNRERATLNLALRGVSTDLLQPVEVQERDLASVQARATRMTAIIPMFIIMAVLYGALTAALDSTAGERERGSLEPLLMNPVQHLALVTGKWCAVATLGMAVALISSLSFAHDQHAQRRRRGLVVPVGAGSEPEHADDAGTQGRNTGLGADSSLCGRRPGAHSCLSELCSVVDAGCGSTVTSKFRACW